VFPYMYSSMQPLFQSNKDNAGGDAQWLSMGFVQVNGLAVRNQP
jgi:hypothetical protein